MFWLDQASSSGSVLAESIESQDLSAYQLHTWPHSTFTVRTSFQFTSSPDLTIVHRILPSTPLSFYSLRRGARSSAGLLESSWVLSTCLFSLPLRSGAKALPRSSLCLQESDSVSVAYSYLGAILFPMSEWKEMRAVLGFCQQALLLLPHMPGVYLSLLVSWTTLMKVILSICWLHRRHGVMLECQSNRSDVGAFSHLLLECMSQGFACLELIITFLHSPQWNHQ